VFLCAGLGHDNRLYIIDVRRGKWEAPELIKEAKAFINKHKESNTKNLVTRNPNLVTQK
jgi:hypothetical protein